MKLIDEFSIFLGDRVANFWIFPDNKGKMLQVFPASDGLSKILLLLIGDFLIFVHIYLFIFMRPIINLHTPPLSPRPTVNFRIFFRD